MRCQIKVLYLYRIKVYKYMRQTDRQTTGVCVMRDAVCNFYYATFSGVCFAVADTRSQLDNEIAKFLGK